MKKGTVFGLVLAILSLIVLGGLTAWLILFVAPEIHSDSCVSDAILAEDASVFLLYEDETSEEKTDAEKTSDETAAKQKASPEIRDLKCEDHEEEAAATEETTETADETEAAGTASAEGAPSIIWVGDSRTVAMGRAMNNDDVYIGESGEGYYWLDETGLPLIINAIASYPGVPVVFNFGVNDDENLDQYLILYRALEEQYPETDFYYMAVNPIEPTLCSNISNEEISAFNQALKTTFPDAYIDSFTFVMISEIVTIDGIHYSEDDSRAIYEYAAAQLARMQN